MIYPCFNLTRRGDVKAPGSHPQSRLELLPILAIAAITAAFAPVCNYHNNNMMFFFRPKFCEPVCKTSNARVGALVLMKKKKLHGGWWNIGATFFQIMKAEFFSPKTFFVRTWRRYGAMTPISSIVTFVLSNPEIRSATFIVSTAHHTAIILGLFFKPSKNNHDATN